MKNKWIDWIKKGVSGDERKTQPLSLDKSSVSKKLSRSLSTKAKNLDFEFEEKLKDVLQVE